MDSMDLPQVGGTTPCCIVDHANCSPRYAVGTEARPTLCPFGYILYADNEFTAAVMAKHWHKPHTDKWHYRLNDSEILLPLPRVESCTWTLVIIFTALWYESELQEWHRIVSSLFILPRSKINLKSKHQLERKSHLRLQPLWSKCSWFW